MAADDQKARILERLSFEDYYRGELGELLPGAGDEVMALCPFHADHDPSLSVNLKTGLFNCFACGGGDVFAFHQRKYGVGFKEALAELGRRAGVEMNSKGKEQWLSLPLEQFAREKQLPVEFLTQNGVKENRYRDGVVSTDFHYLDAGGRLRAIRHRFANRGVKKFRWRKGDKVLPYGLWKLAKIREAGWCLLVEGETDSLTCWLHGLPALGLPGKKTWGRCRGVAGRLEGLQVYLWEEPDAGRRSPKNPREQLLREAVAADVPGLLVIPAPAGCKDLSEAFCQGRDLKVLVQELKATAHPVELPTPDQQGEKTKLWYVGHYYFEEDGRLCLETYDKFGEPKTRPLANFRARIMEEVSRDDGLQIRKDFRLSAHLENGRQLPPAQIPAKEFDNLAWVRREWGAAAALAPGRTLAPHLANAILAHSQANGIVRRTVFTHTGWRIINGVWRYLHGGGALGDGEAVEVDLGENLGRYRLPEPGGPAAAAASLRFLDIGAWEVTAPLLACAYLAPLAEVLQLDFSLWLYGPTGSQKSTMAALVLSHFGDFDRRSLPGSWFSTVNSLERLCFILKDCLVVIDDYMPASSLKDAHKMSEKAGRLVYQAGNRSSRGRLSSDLTARVNHYPRGLIISTGEMLLPGQRQSATARYLGVELDPKKTPLDLAQLTDAQEEAHLYAEAMAAYLAWLAPQLDEIKEEMIYLWGGYRIAFRSTTHPRMPEIQAWLTVGFELMLRFQQQVGGLAPDSAYEMLKDAWQVFKVLGEKHSRIIAGQQPTLKFMAILRELLLTGRVYAESDKFAASAPPGKDLLGWEGSEPVRNAFKVGWANEAMLYLLPETAYRVVSEAIRAQGAFLAVGQNELMAALAREGLIVPGKDRPTRPVRIQGGVKRVICLPLCNLSPQDADEEPDVTDS